MWPTDWSGGDGVLVPPTGPLQPLSPLQLSITQSPVDFITGILGKVKFSLEKQHLSKAAFGVWVKTLWEAPGEKMWF